MRSSSVEGLGVLADCPSSFRVFAALERGRATR